MDNCSSKRKHAFKNSTEDEKMDKLRELWEWIRHPIQSYKEHKAFNKRLEELRKRDPFIYK
jgi:hypothetical protein